MATTAGRMPQRRMLLPNQILGMGIFIVTEMMFFAGLISAYSISRAGAISWPPPGQPRLPIEVTAINTLILAASGFIMYRADRAAKASGRLDAIAVQVGHAAILGATFVLVQGIEWARLLQYGLRLGASGLYGSFFYLIVGAHALHALGGITVLLWFRRGIRKGTVSIDTLHAVTMFWVFVAGLWPILYTLVYLW